MKICDLTQSYHATSGGIKTYISEKKRFIHKDKSLSHVLIVPGDSDKIESYDNQRVYHVKGIQLPNYKSYRFIVRMDKIFKILQKEKPDIIEIGSPYLMPYPAMLYRKISRKPVIGFYHTDFPECYVRPFLEKSFKKKNYSGYLQIAENYNRFIYSKCNALIVSTDKFYDKLSQMRIRNIEQISLGVDLELFHPHKRNKEIRKEWQAAESDKIFIYSGRLDEEKRITLLLSAIKDVSKKIQGKFVIIGDGPKKEKAVNLASENSHVFYYPYEKNRNQLAEYLASADVYITAGPHETFGLSIIEAQASGLPVLGVRSGALIDRVRESNGILVEPDSKERMIEGIRKMANSMNLLEMGKDARRTVEKQYSWNNTFSTLFQLYERQLNEKN